MLKHRLFNVLIAIVLMLALALTVREAIATTAIASGTDSVITCKSLPSRYSLHTEYVKEAGMRVAYTEDGPTGVDGGLIYLLSAYRTCAR